MCETHSVKYPMLHSHRPQSIHVFLDLILHSAASVLHVLRQIRVSVRLNLSENEGLAQTMDATDKGEGSQLWHLCKNKLLFHMPITSHVCVHADLLWRIIDQH